MRGFISLICIFAGSIYYGKHVGWESTFQNLGFNQDIELNKTKVNNKLKVTLTDYDCSIDFDRINVQGTVTNENKQDLLLRVETTIDFEDGGVIRYTSHQGDRLHLPPDSSDSFNFTGSTNNNFGLVSCDLEFLDVLSRTYVRYQ